MTSVSETEMQRTVSKNMHYCMTAMLDICRGILFHRSNKVTGEC
jgi:hypothetical protein